MPGISCLSTIRGAFDIINMPIRFTIKVRSRMKELAVI